MRQAIRARDIPDTRDKHICKNRQISQSKTITESIKDKRFEDLTSEEKDDLFKAMALRLGMILPD